MHFFYQFNTKNPAANYRSGQEFHVDYALAQHLSATFAVGLGGYYYHQTTGDTLNGTEVNTTAASTLATGGGKGNFGETFALGPLVDVSLGKAVLKFSWDHEFFAYNRPQADLFYGRIAVGF
jgi:hypothetical protein